MFTMERLQERTVGALEGARRRNLVWACNDHEVAARRISSKAPIKLQRKPVAALLQTMTPDLHPQTWYPSLQRCAMLSFRHHHHAATASDTSYRHRERPAEDLATATQLPTIPAIEHVEDVKDVEMGYSRDSGGGSDGFGGDWERMNEASDGKWSAFDAEAPSPWVQAPTRADQEALAMALLASINTARQHGTLGAVPAGIGPKPDANAATRMGKLLKPRKNRKSRSIFRKREVDLSRLYTGDDLNQLNNLPAKTAKKMALERIRAALNEVQDEHARKGRSASSANAWSLESSDDSDSELMKTDASRRDQRDKDKDTYNAWCIQICCRNMCSDLASVYEDLMSWLLCRAPPTLKCVGLACTVMYCGMMAAGILALFFLNPGQSK